MTIKYENLTPEEFDAIVTGELTHYAIWFEQRLNQFFVHYLGILGDRRQTFTGLFLYREGLTFQDKIDIAKALFKDRNKRLVRSGLATSDRKKTYLDRALKLLDGIEKFKSIRNALAHGLNVTDLKEGGVPTLGVELINRSGQERTHIITPDSHREMCNKLDDALQELNEVLRGIEAWCWTETLDDMKGEVGLGADVSRP